MKEKLEETMGGLAALEAMFAHAHNVFAANALKASDGTMLHAEAVEIEGALTDARELAGRITELFEEAGEQGRNAVALEEIAEKVGEIGWSEGEARKTLAASYGWNWRWAARELDGVRNL